jgi:hypothetical protein
MVRAKVIVTLKSAVRIQFSSVRRGTVELPAGPTRELQSRDRQTEPRVCAFGGASGLRSAQPPKSWSNLGQSWPCNLIMSTMLHQ